MFFGVLLADGLRIDRRTSRVVQNAPFLIREEVPDFRLQLEGMETD